MKRMLIGLLATLLTLPALAERKHSVGEYDIHYIAFNSGFLQPDIAAAAGLVRSKTQGVVNVSVVKDGKPVAAQVSGQVKNLLGQDRQLTFKQLKEGDEAIYYLAQFPSTPRKPCASASPCSRPARSRSVSSSTRNSSPTDDAFFRTGAGQSQRRQTQGTPGHARRRRARPLGGRVQHRGAGRNRPVLHRERHSQGAQCGTDLRPAGLGR